MKVTASPSGQQRPPQRPPQRPQAPAPAPRPAPRPQQPAVVGNMGDEDEDLTFFERVIRFVRTKWKIILPVTLVLVIAVGYWFSHSASSARANEERVRALAQSGSAPSASESVGPDGVDQLLMNQQPSLREKYGTPKPGFIWDVDGTLLSLGNPDTPPDEVAYAYLRALNTLDFTTAEASSRRSSVTTTYADFFDTDTAASTDYKDQYQRDRYRLGLLSLQVQSVTRGANFSTDKQVYTVRAKMLDFTNKTFWTKDRDTIFQNLRDYNKGESDTSKGDQYVYTYVTNAYQQAVDHLQTTGPQEGDAPMRDVTFDLTVQRYPAQNSGWLVSIDKDLDNLLRNTDGVDVATYIREQYKDSNR